MDFKKLTDRAKDLVDKRGGTDSLKQDAEELKGIATGQGSLSDKAKAAVSAIKEPGAAEQESPAAATAAERDRAAAKVEDDERGKHGHGAGGGHRKGNGKGQKRRRDADPEV